MCLGKDVMTHEIAFWHPKKVESCATKWPFGSDLWRDATISEARCCTNSFTVVAMWPEVPTNSPCCWKWCTTRTQSGLECLGQGLAKWLYNILYTWRMFLAGNENNLQCSSMLSRSLPHETSTSTSRSSSTNDNFFGQARAKHSAVFGFILLFHLHVSGEWLENICITHNRKTLLCTTDCYAESSRVGGKANAVCVVAPCHEGCHGCQKMLENAWKCTCPHVLPSCAYLT